MGMIIGPIIIYCVIDGWTLCNTISSRTTDGWLKIITLTSYLRGFHQYVNGLKIFIFILLYRYLSPFDNVSNRHRNHLVFQTQDFSRARKLLLSCACMSYHCLCYCHVHSSRTNHNVAKSLLANTIFNWSIDQKQPMSARDTMIRKADVQKCTLPINRVVKEP